MTKQRSTRALGTFAGIVALSVCALGIGGCFGQSKTQGDATRRQGPLKPIRWGIIDMGRQSVRVGAFVPYCKYTKPEPFVERVKRRRRRGGRVLTMLVQFPPKRTGGCLGESSVTQWVKLGPGVERLRLFDGFTSPPERRRRTG